MTLIERLPERLRSPRVLGWTAVAGLAAVCAALVLHGGPGAPPPPAATARPASAPARPGGTPPLAAAPPEPPPVVALQDMTPEQALAANQAIAFSTLPNPPAKPFRMQGASADDQAKAETCLAQAVYYEAGFEPLAGEQAVAQVVLNRLRHPVYPKTVCGVVFQGSDLPTGCQFTFTCDGALGRPPEPAAWTRAVAVAHAALNGFVMKAVGEATHYHTQYVLPYWSPSLVKLTQVGQHIFYRWTGTFGQPPAFAGRYAGDEPGSPGALAAPLPPAMPAPVLTGPVALAAPTADEAGPAVASADDASPLRPGGETAAPPAEAPSAPVALARPELPAAGAIDTTAPQTGPVRKVFIPAESRVPRPRFRPF